MYIWGDIQHVMRKKDLVELGFKPVKVSAEESGDKAYTYYHYMFGNTPFGLLADKIDGEWQVAMFPFDGFKFKDKKELKTLIDILNNSLNL